MLFRSAPFFLPGQGVCKKCAKTRNAAGRWAKSRFSTAPPTSASASPNPSATPTPTTSSSTTVAAAGSSKKSSGKLCAKNVYHVNAGRHVYAGRHAVSRLVPYLPEEIHFLAVLIVPEDTWYIIPVQALDGRVSLRIHSPQHPVLSTE